VYSEHERPSTKRILITVGAVVAVIVVAIASAAVGINLMAPRYSPGGADRPARAEAQTPATETVSVPTAAPAPASPVTTQDVAPGASAAPAAAAPAPAAAPSPKPTADAGLGVVVIDAGHQGHGDSGLEPESPAKNAPMKPKVESGASGPYAPHEESEVNLQVALKLRDVLESRGVTVKMIRTTQNVDIPNSERAKMANAWHAALFIRLHCDSAASSVSGILTEVPAKNY